MKKEGAAHLRKPLFLFLACSMWPLLVNFDEKEEP